MRIMLYACAGLLTATTAIAAPITAGTWLLAPVASELGDAPWNHPSYDGGHQNAGYILGIGQGELAGAEYLAAPFTFPGFAGGEVFTWTAFAQGTVSQAADGRFLFDNPETGDHFDSSGDGWRQFVLLRQVLSPTTTTYRLMVEDMGLYTIYPGMGPSDADFQDHILAFTENTPSQPVPEPVSLALFGLGLLAVRRRTAARG